jgi:hypothetical protein
MRQHPLPRQPSVKWFRNEKDDSDGRESAVRMSLEKATAVLISITPVSPVSARLVRLRMLLWVMRRRKTENLHMGPAFSSLKTQKYRKVLSRATQ